MTNTLNKMIIAVLLIFLVSCTSIKNDLNPVQDGTSKTSGIKTFSSLVEIEQFIRQNRISNYGFSEMRSFAADSISTPMTTSAQMEATKSSYSPDYSQTNVQVEGVDEADIVKTDGKYLYVLSQNKIFILDAQPAEKTNIISTISFVDETIQEFFVNKNKLIVFGTAYYSNNQPRLLEKIPSIVDSIQTTDEIFPSKMSIARMPIYQENNAFMRVYDLTKLQQPVQEKNIEITGYYTDSRMINEHVYAVINSGIGYDRISLPQITIDETTKEIDASSISYFDYPDYNYRITNVLSLNLNTQEVQQKSYLIGDSGQLYASEKNLYITHQQMLQPYETLQDLLKEVMLALPASAVKEIEEIQSIGLSKQDTYQEIMSVLNKHAGNTDPLTSTTFIEPLKKIVPKDVAEQIKRIQSSTLSSDKKTEYISRVIKEYLTTMTVEERNKFEASMQEQFSSLLQDAQKNQETLRKAMQTAQEKIARRQEQTRIHKISLDKGNIKYQASNSVPGRVLNQYSMDEYQDVFRIATTTGWQGSESNVYALDKNLKQIGSLEGLAPGEQIYSARFMGPKAYLVTFRQVDPLFVIDLSNPTAPRVLGKLKIPGFSNYLHPYDETHLIGIGKDADETGRTKGL
ncbi:MAG: beta-propeller domain-containing protein, partial [Candidatus Woesearchaeota archaeon]|nr:beta-propeller domain-containing protein [Candidatus Woesearchaeota archaeon]